MHDFSLYSGERQVGKNLNEIRRDHMARYELAYKFLRNNSHEIGLDCFCGNGYGSYYLATKLGKNISILGVDGSEEAINFANRYYNCERVFFSHKLFPFSLPKNALDFVISFESIEHVENGNLMIENLIHSLTEGGHIIFSVPNEKIHSLKLNHHPFHKKHYDDAEIKQIFKGYRMRLVKQYGQDVYVFRNGVQAELLDIKEMNLRENYNGQVLIYIYQKSETTPKQNLPIFDKLISYFK